MREQLNINPVVQLTVIGVLVVIVGLFFMLNMKKKSDSPTTSTTAAASAGAVPGATTPDATGAAATAGAAAPSLPTAPPTTGTVTPEALVPGPGLPKDLIDAWKGGDAVALLIVRGGGIDDRLVPPSLSPPSGGAGVSGFVAQGGDGARDAPH